MLRIQQNAFIKDNYFPALDGIRFGIEMSESTDVRFDKITQDSFRASKLIDYLQDLHKHEKRK